MGDFLKKQNRPLITSYLIHIHEKYRNLFEFVLSEGNRKPIRDKISHYEYAPVGCINLSQHGFILVGGGEKLGIDGKNQPLLLSEVLYSHVTNIRGCISDMLFAYVDGIKAEQQAKNV